MDREGVGRASAGLQTPRDMVVVVVSVWCAT